MELLTLKDITKEYNSGERCVPVDHCSFSLSEGDFISIQGVSGSGKSSLLMIMGGILQPTSGQVLYKGQDVYRMSDKELSAWRGRHIGYLFQNAQMVQALTVEENIVHFFDRGLPEFISGETCGAHENGGHCCDH